MTREMAEQISVELLRAGFGLVAQTGIDQHRAKAWINELKDAVLETDDSALRLDLLSDQSRGAIVPLALLGVLAYDLFAKGLLGSAVLGCELSITEFAADESRKQNLAGTGPARNVQQGEKR